MAEPILPKDTDDAREADYMTACWKWKHHDATGAASLEELAKANHLFPAFLENWWSILNSELPKSRFLDLTRVAWRELPGPDPAKPAEIPEAVQKGFSIFRRSGSRGGIRSGPAQASSGGSRMPMDCVPTISARKSREGRRCISSSEISETGTAAIS